MSLNSSSYFSRTPSVNLKRNAFWRDKTVKTSFNNGQLIPIYCSEILPGDTVSLDMSSVVRMSTPIKPILDNLIQETFFFFVPNRLVWSHWKEFMGEVSTGHWTPSVEYTVPQVSFPHDNASIATWFKETDMDSTKFSIYISGITDGTYVGPTLYKGIASSPYYSIISSSDTFDSSATYYFRYGGWSPNSLATYFGFPIGAIPQVNDPSNPGSYVTAKVSALPFRAYGLIWNDLFRDQNYMDPVDIHFNDDNDIDGKDAYIGDHWTGYAGVTPTFDYNYVTDTVKGALPLRVCRFHDYFSSGLPQPQRGSDVAIPFGVSGSSPVFQSGNLFFNASSVPTDSKSLFIDAGSAGNRNVNFQVSEDLDTFNAINYKSGLFADLSAISNAATISDLRTAFQVQKFLETYARSGTRYTEICHGFFGVTNPDSRLQRPELVGYQKHFLNVTQVLQTSSTDITSPQGNTSAYSLTTNKDSLFTKSFTEHGWLIGLTCTRTSRSYSSGVNKSFLRRRKYDYYWPMFSHLSEEPIKNLELYCYSSIINPSSAGYNEGVFAYQERYAEYRYDPDLCTADMSPYSPQSLSFWHFGDYYEGPVYASMDWLLEGPENVDRTLAVTSAISHQFIADFYFKAKFVRPMPLYSVPGLADHF